MSLESVLDTYIENENDLAFEINGDWGSGKTYAIKEYIRSKEEIDPHVFNYLKSRFEVENAYNLKNEKLPITDISVARSRTEYKFIYASVNGIKNINELSNEILSQLFAESFNVKENTRNLLSVFMGSDLTIQNQLENKIIKFNTTFRLFSGLFDLMLEMYPSIKEGRIGNKKIIFVIDDLERVVDQSLIKEIFGYISVNLQEKFGAKVVIIGNDKKIRQEFKDLKEKVIGFKYDFRLTENLQTNNLIKEYFNEEGQQIAIANVLYALIDSFKGKEEINLRILKSVIVDIKYVVSKIFPAKTNEVGTGVRLKNFVEWMFISGYFIRKKGTRSSFDTLKKMYSFLEVTTSQFSSYFDVYEIVSDYFELGILRNRDLVEIYKNHSSSQIQDSINELYSYQFMTDLELRLKQQNLVVRITEKDNSLNLMELRNFAELFKYFDNFDLWLVDDFDFPKLVELLISSQTDSDFRGYELSEQGKQFFLYSKEKYPKYQNLTNHSNRVLQNIRSSMLEDVTSKIYNDLNIHLAIESQEEKKDQIFQAIYDDLIINGNDRTNKELKYLRENVDKLWRGNFTLSSNFWIQYRAKILDCIDNMKENINRDKIGVHILNELEESFMDIAPNEFKKTRTIQ